MPSITRKQFKKNQMLDQVFKNDLGNHITSLAGTSVVGVNKLLSRRDECTDINADFFQFGCIPYHSSQFTNSLEEDQIALLDRCLEQVKNDRRCVGNKIYTGLMRKSYWPVHVSLKEEEVVYKIFEFVPTFQVFTKLVDEDDVVHIRVTFEHEQKYRGNNIRILIRFDLECNNDNSDYLIQLRIRDESAEDLIYYNIVTFEEMRNLVQRLIHEPFVDFTSDENDVNHEINSPQLPIRLKGNLPGQEICIFCRNGSLENYSTKTLMEIHRH
jgi:hypothetical protein